MGKKKGAANKLARMSEEERARYLQHRADMEEEARRRKQQLIAIFMKNKLKREDAFSRLNLAKINQEWRSILRNVKSNELRNELKSVQKYFQDALMRKNQTIDRLLFELDESEELYATMMHSHMENIERLIVLHSDRVNFWLGQYEREKKILLSQYGEEMDQYKDRKFKAHKELECVYYGLENIAEKEKDQAEIDHQKKIDNIKSKMILKLETITQQRESHMNDLWHEMQTILKNYLECTEEKMSEYILLRDRDNENTEIIRQHYIEIERAAWTINDLKQKMDTTRTTHKIHLEQLLKYKQLLVDKQNRMKADMEAGLKLDKERMKQLVVCCTDAQKNLQKWLEKGRNMLQIAAICKKLETEREKIIPFGRQTGSSVSTAKKRQNLSKLPDEDFKDETLTALSQMENFWIRYNNARIDCACLEEERAALKRENAILQQKLKEYLSNVCLNNGGFHSETERLRPSSMKVEKIVHIDLATNNQTVIKSEKSKVSRRRPVTSIEANLSVAVRSQKLIQERTRTPCIFPIA